MKLAYIVTYFEGINTGTGGHYFSLLVLFDALKKRHDVEILVVGDAMPSAFQHVEYVRLVPFLQREDQSGVDALARMIDESDISVIHSFDAHAHRVAKAASAVTEVAHVITKPGGGPSRFSYPWAHDIILFTREDCDWFRAHPYFKDTRIHFLPNRVALSECDSIRTEELKAYIQKDYFVFMVIATVDHRKIEQLEQSIRLVNQLAESGEQVQLILIGFPKDEVLVRCLSQLAGPNCVLLHEEPFVRKASVYLPLADVVIAMGRGVMEAAAIGKPVMTSGDGAEYPYFLDKNTFEPAFSANFTKRARIECSSAQTLLEAKKMLHESDTYERHSSFMSNMYEKYFNIETVLEQYDSIYELAEPSQRRFYERKIQRVLGYVVNKCNWLKCAK